MKRQIEVTPEVFHLIWSSWRQGDTDEDSILKRILISFRVSLDLETSAGTTSRRPHPCGTEEKTYEQQDILISDGPAVGGVGEMGKIRWVDDVRKAVSSLGGEADLSAIYREVEQIRRTAGRSVVRSLEATVRQTIEAHSSHSENFKPGNADYFRHVGRGRWALR